MIFLPSLLVSICRALHFYLHSLQNHGLHLLFLHPSISHTQYLQRYFLAVSSFTKYFPLFIDDDTLHSGIIRRPFFVSSLSLYSIFVFLRSFFNWTLTGLLLSANFPAFQPSNSKRDFCWSIPSHSFSGSLHRTLQFICKQLASTGFSIVSVSSS
jgi:hypothetical protein